MAITITGKLVKSIIRREVDIYADNKYSPNSEKYVIYLDCELHADDGSRYYFQTPKEKMNVSNCPGAAIVTFASSEYKDGSYVWPVNHPWFTQSGSISIATRGVAADVRLDPKVSIGDTIVITGRVKKTAVSKIGKPYIVLNYVKRVS